MVYPDTPPNTPKKHKLMAPPAKKLKKDKDGASAGSAIENTTQEERTGTVGGVDTGTSGYISILSSPSVLGQYPFRTKKVFKFFTRAIPKKLIYEDYGESSGYQQWFSSCLQCIPTDLLCFYMSPGEYSALPKYDVFVTKTHTKVDFLNARTSFQANASDVTSAATSHQLYIEMCDKAIESHNGVPGKYTRPTGSTADISTFEPVTLESNVIDEYINMLYGPTTLTATMRAPAVTGTEVENPYYVSFIVKNTRDGPTSRGLELPNVDEFYTTSLAINNMNTTVLEQTNHYVNGRIKPQKEIWHPFLAPVNDKVPTAVRVYPTLNEPQTTTMETHGVDGAISFTNSQHNYGLDNHNYQYTDYIEKSYLQKYGMGFTSEFPRHNWLYAGLREIISVNQNESEIEYQDGQAFWQITYELEGYFDLSTHSVRGVTVPYTAYGYSDSRPEITQLGMRNRSRLFGKGVTLENV